jgi:hypothetical protein
MVSRTQEEEAQIISEAVIRRTAGGSPVEAVGIVLRDAQPEKAFLVHLNEKKAVECDVPDLRTLEGITDQGFDPQGVLGPTYYRMTETHYYSTFFTKEGVTLTITKLK